MEITLEKIELVKDRTGVTYKEAKEALEAADGSVVDAIINIEETMETSDSKTMGNKGAAIVESIKELVKKGNVSKIVVKKADGDAVVNIPVNAGIVGLLIAPWGMLAGAIAAFGFKCIIEVVKTDGTIIDVSDRANEAVQKAKEKGSEFADVAKEKSADVYEKVKSSDMYEKVANSEPVEKVMDAAESAIHKTSDALTKTTEALKKKKQEAAEEFADAFADAEEKAEEVIDDIKDKVEDVAEEIEKAVKEGKK
jgi:hypothetical protein